MSENKMATKEDLKEFYNRIYPYLGGSAAAGFTPIGTIIPMIAETAPANYLICDGTAYNKSDYPELAVHLLAMTNHSMYEVSGDATKFKVPDLRGEFIRMTGTNSHANQGSGETVGVHQNGTTIPVLRSDEINAYITTSKENNYSLIPLDYDYMYSSTGRKVRIFSKTDATQDDSTENTRIIARPTNTSVLFCIATKNIYLNPSLDYSTDEKVVGTWIDGKTIYQKTIIETFTTMSSDIATSKFIDLSSLNIEFLVSHQIIGKMNDTNGDESQLNTAWLSGNDMKFVQASYHGKNHSSVPRTLQITTNRATFSEATIYITIQYTKTTS